MLYSTGEWIWINAQERKRRRVSLESSYGVETCEAEKGCGKWAGVLMPRTEISVKRYVDMELEGLKLLLFSLMYFNNLYHEYFGKNTWR